MILPRNTLTMTSRQSLTNLENIRTRKQRAIDEVSTGLKVRRPSDGPTQAGGVVRTRNELRNLGQFRSSLQAVSDQLRTADTALSQAIDTMIRANSLASQGATFSQTAETRASIAAEVTGLIQNLVAVANVSLGDKFLFGGLNEDTLPFVLDSASPDGVVYRGDEGRRSVGFPGGTVAPSSIDGKFIFLNPDSFRGLGRVPGAVGAAAPYPPVGVGITFSEGLNGTIYANLPGFFVASAAPSVPAAGNQVTVNFTAADGTINRSVTATMIGGETTASIATLLNAQIAVTPELAGKFTFSDQGGRLKLVESDTAGVGFSFTATATGGFVTGLESGGTVGGMSAQEIAAALNAQVALNPPLATARVRFSAVGGQVEVDADTNFSFTAVDFPRATGFVSGLAGKHKVGGLASANVFRALNDLRQALLNNDPAAILATVDAIGRAVDHLSSVQGFYGSTDRQILSVLDSLNRFELVNREKLASFQDADVVQSIAELRQAEVNEEAALRVAASQSGRSLFDFLA